MPKTDSSHLVEMLRVRVSEKMLERIDAERAVLGESRSEWIRRLLAEHLLRPRV